MRILTDAQLAELKGNHEWEVRRLTAQVTDAESNRDRYRGGYKRSIRAMKMMRVKIAELSKALLEAGIGPEPPVKEGEERRLSTVQGVMDSALQEIPAMDEGARGAVREYVEREFRMRGSEYAEAILAEVVGGGFLEDE